MNINTMENTSKKYEAIIFDLDGTLYDTSIVDPLLRQLRQVKRMSPEYHQIWIYQKNRKRNTGRQLVGIA